MKRFIKKVVGFYAIDAFTLYERCYLSILWSRYPASYAGLEEQVAMAHKLRKRESKKMANGYRNALVQQIKDAQVKNLSTELNRWCIPKMI